MAARRAKAQSPAEARRQPRIQRAKPMAATARMYHSMVLMRTSTPEALKGGRHADRRRPWNEKGTRFDLWTEYESRPRFWLWQGDGGKLLRGLGEALSA